MSIGELFDAVSRSNLPAAGGVFEKNGSEVVGGVVLMRHGGNPLRLTEAVKAKIEKLKPGLPEGVRIVPAYDRTRLINGAIHTLATVMWHEMAIAAFAILLILTHIRSAFVSCITLPLLKALERREYLSAADDRDSFVNDVTQKALERFDEVMRELALLRFREIEKDIGPTAGADDAKLDQWHERVKAVNWELFDRGTEAFTWFALEEVAKAARGQGLLDRAPKGEETERFASQSVRVVLGKFYEPEVFPPFGDLRAELEKAFREKVIFRSPTGGPKGDLVDDEMGRVLQVPGWSNIFTQPIVNRIEMLSSGVRTDIGIKVFGPDLETVTQVCQQIEAAVKPLTGARDVVAAPIMGKGYLEIAIDREKAARFGVSIEDVQTEIETALGGRVVTYTVESRERFPVRVRYARVQREDEDAVKRLLVPAGMAGAPKRETMTGDPTFRAEAHGAVAEHSAKGKRFIPLTAVASVRITEAQPSLRARTVSF